MPRTVEWTHTPADEGLDEIQYQTLRELEEGRLLSDVELDAARDRDELDALLDLEAAGLVRQQLIPPVAEEEPFHAWVVTDAGRTVLLRVGHFREARRTFGDALRDYAVVILAAVLAWVAIAMMAG